VRSKLTSEKAQNHKNNTHWLIVNLRNTLPAGTLFSFAYLPMLREAVGARVDFTRIENQDGESYNAQAKR